MKNTRVNTRQGSAPHASFGWVDVITFRPCYAKSPGVYDTRALFPFREELLQLHLGADFLDLLLQLLSLVLGDTLLDSLGGGLYQSLGLSQAQAGDLTDSLDDLDLSGGVKAGRCV